MKEHTTRSFFPSSQMRLHLFVAKAMMMVSLMATMVCVSASTQQQQCDPVPGVTWLWREFYDNSASVTNVTHVIVAEENSRWLLEWPMSGAYTPPALVISCSASPPSYLFPLQIIVNSTTAIGGGSSSAATTISTTLNSTSDWVTWWDSVVVDAMVSTWTECAWAQAFSMGVGGVVVGEATASSGTPAVVAEVVRLGLMWRSKSAAAKLRTAPLWGGGGDGGGEAHAWLIRSWLESFFLPSYTIKTLSSSVNANSDALSFEDVPSVTVASLCTIEVPSAMLSPFRVESEYRRDAAATTTTMTTKANVARLNITSSRLGGDRIQLCSPHLVNPNILADAFCTNVVVPVSSSSSTDSLFVANEWISAPHTSGGPLSSQPLLMQHKVALLQLKFVLSVTVQWWTLVGSNNSNSNSNASSNASSTTTSESPLTPYSSDVVDVLLQAASSRVASTLTITSTSAASVDDNSSIVLRPWSCQASLESIVNNTGSGTTTNSKAVADVAVSCWFTTTGWALTAALRSVVAQDITWSNSNNSGTTHVVLNATVCIAGLENAWLMADPSLVTPIFVPSPDDQENEVMEIAVGNSTKALLWYPWVAPPVSKSDHHASSSNNNNTVFNTSSLSTSSSTSVDKGLVPVAVAILGGASGVAAVAALVVWICFRRSFLGAGLGTASVVLAVVTLVVVGVAYDALFGTSDLVVLVSIYSNPSCETNSWAPVPSQILALDAIIASNGGGAAAAASSSTLWSRIVSLGDSFGSPGVTLQGIATCSVDMQTVSLRLRGTTTTTTVTSSASCADDQAQQQHQEEEDGVVVAAGACSTLERLLPRYAFPQMTRCASGPSSSMPPLTFTVQCVTPKQATEMLSNFAKHMNIYYDLQRRDEAPVNASGEPSLYYRSTGVGDGGGSSATATIEVTGFVQQKSSGGLVGVTSTLAQSSSSSSVDVDNTLCIFDKENTIAYSAEQVHNRSSSNSNSSSSSPSALLPQFVTDSVIGGIVAAAGNDGMSFVNGSDVVRYFGLLGSSSSSSGGSSSSSSSKLTRTVFAQRVPDSFTLMFFVRFHDDVTTDDEKMGQARRRPLKSSRDQPHIGTVLAVLDSLMSTGGTAEWTAASSSSTASATLSFASANDADAAASLVVIDIPHQQQLCNSSSSGNSDNGNATTAGTPPPQQPQQQQQQPPRPRSLHQCIPDRLAFACRHGLLGDATDDSFLQQRGGWFTSRGVLGTYTARPVGGLNEMLDSSSGSEGLLLSSSPDPWLSVYQLAHVAVVRRRPFAYREVTIRLGSIMSTTTFMDQKPLLAWRIAESTDASSHNPPSTEVIHAVSGLRTIATNSGGSHSLFDYTPTTSSSNGGYDMATSSWHLVAVVCGMESGFERCQLYLDGETSTTEIGWTQCSASHPFPHAVPSPEQLAKRFATAAATASSSSSTFSSPKGFSPMDSYELHAEAIVGSADLGADIARVQLVPRMLRRSELKRVMRLPALSGSSQTAGLALGFTGIALVGICVLFSLWDLFRSLWRRHGDRLMDKRRRKRIEFEETARELVAPLPAIASTSTTPPQTTTENERERRERLIQGQLSSAQQSAVVGFQAATRAGGGGGGTATTTTTAAAAGGTTSGTSTVSATGAAAATSSFTAPLRYLVSSVLYVGQMLSVYFSSWSWPSGFTDVARHMVGWLTLDAWSFPWSAVTREYVIPVLAVVLSGFVILMLLAVLKRDQDTFATISKKWFRRRRRRGGNDHDVGDAAAGTEEDVVDPAEEVDPAQIDNKIAAALSHPHHLAATATAAAEVTTSTSQSNYNNPRGGVDGDQSTSTEHRRLEAEAARLSASAIPTPPPISEDYVIMMKAVANQQNMNQLRQQQLMSFGAGNDDADVMLRLELQGALREGKAFLNQQSGLMMAAREDQLQRWAKAVAEVEEAEGERRRQQQQQQQQQQQPKAMWSPREEGGGESNKAPLSFLTEGEMKEPQRAPLLTFVSTNEPSPTQPIASSDATVPPRTTTVVSGGAASPMATSSAAAAAELTFVRREEREKGEEEGQQQPAPRTTVSTEEEAASSSPPIAGGAISLSLDLCTTAGDVISLPDTDGSLTDALCHLVQRCRSGSSVAEVESRPLTLNNEAFTATLSAVWIGGQRGQDRNAIGEGGGRDDDDAAVVQHAVRRAVIDRIMGNRDSVAAAGATLRQNSNIVVECYLAPHDVLRQATTRGFLVVSLIGSGVRCPTHDGYLCKATDVHRHAMKFNTNTSSVVSRDRRQQSSSSPPPCRCVYDSAAGEAYRRMYGLSRCPGGAVYERDTFYFCPAVVDSSSSSSPSSPSPSPSLCSFVVCDACYEGSTSNSLWSTVLGYWSMIKLMGGAQVAGYLALLLAQLLLAPVTQTCCLILVCHAKYQCVFPGCYAAPSVSFLVLALLAALTMAFLHFGMTAYLVTLVRRRKAIIASGFELDGEDKKTIPARSGDRRVEPGEQQLNKKTWRAQLAGIFLSMSSSKTSSLALADWRQFLDRDSSVLKPLYEPYTFSYMWVQPLMMTCKAMAVLPAVLGSEDSLTQLGGAWAVEVFFLLVTTCVPQLFSDHWISWMSRMACVHQSGQVSLNLLLQSITPSSSSSSSGDDNINDEKWVGVIQSAMLWLFVGYLAQSMCVLLGAIALPMAWSGWKKHKREKERQENDRQNPYIVVGSGGAHHDATDADVSYAQRRARPPGDPRGRRR